MNFIKNKIIFILSFYSFIYAQEFNSHNKQNDIIEIGSRLEIFVDHFLVDSLINTDLKMHHPTNRGKVLEFNKPWEGPFSGYCTVIYNGKKFQMYYRGRPDTGRDGGDDEVTCYAESRDGIIWTKPNIGLHDLGGNKNNNIILSGIAPVTHNFSPFLDTRKDVDPNERYKALGGTSGSGLIALVSPDGITWNKLQKNAVFSEGQFDSQNVAFWSANENRYICYFRTWAEHENKRYRTVSRTVSEDFIHWSNPEEMSFGDTPKEHLYTNQTAPYFRAPHIYISVAARFMPGRQVLSEEDALSLNVNPKYFNDCSDAVLMSSRGEINTPEHYGCFYPPGDRTSKLGVALKLSCLNIVQTGPEEMSIYVNQDYAQPSAHIRRYTLRLDGFTSINASYTGGEVITKPFIFSGDSLFINYSTSAAGFIKVGIIDKNGDSVYGYSSSDCEEIIGNEIKKLVSWNGKSKLDRFHNKVIRLRFEMKDSDLYSIRFR